MKLYQPTGLTGKSLNTEQIRSRLVLYQPKEVTGISLNTEQIRSRYDTVSA
jgi:hypothetical protein